MADKKAIVILAPQADLNGTGSGLDMLRKKAALFSNYTEGDVFSSYVPDGGAVTTAPGDVAQAVESGTPLLRIDLDGADAGQLSAALETVLDAVDRKTVLAIVGKGAVAFYGSGINTKAGSVPRAAKAEDVIPTLAYITDFAITGECTGAVLYQALKNPNLKADELGKLKEAITRLEDALARDNREPWDKHDCA